MFLMRAIEGSYDTLRCDDGPCFLQTPCAYCRGDVRSEQLHAAIVRCSRQPDHSVRDRSVSFCRIHDGGVFTAVGLISLVDRTAKLCASTERANLGSRAVGAVADSFLLVGFWAEDPAAYVHCGDLSMVQDELLQRTGRGPVTHTRDAEGVRNADLWSQQLI